MINTYILWQLGWLWIVFYGCYGFVCGCLDDDLNGLEMVSGCTSPLIKPNSAHLGVPHLKKKKKKLTFGSLIVSQQLVNDNQYWRSLLLLWNWFVVISQGVIFWRKKNLIKLFSIVLNSSKCEKCFLIEIKWNLQSQIEIIIDNNQKKKLIITNCFFVMQAQFRACLVVLIKKQYLLFK